MVSILPDSNNGDEYIMLDRTGKIINNSSKSVTEVTSLGRWIFTGVYKPVYFIVDISEKS